MLTFEDVLRQVIVPFARGADGAPSSISAGAIKECERTLTVLAQCRDAVHRASLTAALPSEQLERLSAAAPTGGAPCAYSDLLVGVSLALAEPGRVAVTAALLAAQAEQLASVPRFGTAFLRMAREVLAQSSYVALVKLIEGGSAEVLSSLRGSVVTISRGVSALVANISSSSNENAASMEADYNALLESYSFFVSYIGTSPLFPDPHRLTAAHVVLMQVPDH